MKKRWWVVIAAVGVAAAAIGAWYLLVRDTTTPLSASDLGFIGVAGDAPGDAGIYEYETTGFEEIDALGGARHDYPVVTYLVIEDGACGPTVRWYAIGERWEEWVHCGPDLAVTESTVYHEWFHVPDRAVSTCAEPIYPAVGETTWTVVCPEDDLSTTDVATVIGMETLRIGGQDVETIHIRVVGTTTGSTIGATTTDLWRLPGTALVVRKQIDDDSSNDTRIGLVHYVEQVTLQLRSLTPSG